MDTRILEYFLAVAREENITRAAGVLRVSLAQIKMDRASVGSCPQKKGVPQHALFPQTGSADLSPYFPLSMLTPAIFTFTSRTISPVIFSMAVFTRSCTFSQTSGIL